MDGKLCDCGCGRKAPIARGTVTKRGWKKGESVRFIRGHNQKGKIGPLSINWKNGRTKIKGYVHIYMPEHHRSNPNGYVPEHFLIMENSLGRKIYFPEVVHHIDGDRSNNAIGNLMLFANHIMHLRFHGGRAVKQGRVK